LLQGITRLPADDWQIARIVTDAAAVEITVYKDRIRRFLDGHASLKGVAAGYVLAHELAHAMQGVARHSESGIMKAQWSGEDFTAMVYHKLAFTPVDVELIHRGLARAASRLYADVTKPAPEALRWKSERPIGVCGSVAAPLSVPAFCARKGTYGQHADHGTQVHQL
jgi:hypothetical protein